MSRRPMAVLRDGAGWAVFSQLRETVRADACADVPAALSRVEALSEAGGHAVGFITYEAAPAFDAALKPHAHDGGPLLWFGVFDAPIAADTLGDVRVHLSLPDADTVDVHDCIASQDRAAYRGSIDRIRDYLKAGDTYQVNYTIRVKGRIEGEAFDLFARMARAQSTHWAAYIDTGDVRVVSASPELFVEKRGEVLRSRPMKGTLPRGMSAASDRRHVERLEASEKDRAENVMIVDMIRNDLGRICRPGTVRPTEMFSIERYPTVLQMTSEVRGQSSAGLGDCMAALFPCASITGAPKAHTMELITSLEETPRGVYTGAIGRVRPGGDFSFNVAIRTALVDDDATLTYGVGSGIVWDSTADTEYDECLTKLKVLTRDLPDFELLETLLWESDGGLFLRERHVARLCETAAYFGFRADVDAVQSCLDDARARCESSGAPQMRVRLLCPGTGDPHAECIALDPDALKPFSATLCPQCIDVDDPFLYHKTTHRGVYDAARATAPDCDDVLLMNARGDLTEFTIGNLVLRHDGRLLTPPVDCGLLAGTFRDELLERGEIEEGIVTADMLDGADVYLVNSLRRWVPVQMRPHSPAAAGLDS